MADIMYCKHCGAEVLDEKDICPKCFPERKKTEAVPAIFLLVLVCSSLLMLGTSYVNVRTIEPAKARLSAQPKATQEAAYTAAVNFVLQRFPGEKSFDSLHQTAIQQKGNRYVALLIASEVMANQDVVRSSYEVEMSFEAGEWKLATIRQ